jgi:hypothetical protein
MSTRIQLGEVKIIDLYRESKKSFFRVEALESYNVASEADALDKYFSGDPLPKPLDATKEWYKLMTRCAQEGRPTQRVRAVSQKLSPYVRWEMEWVYNQAAQYGESFNVIVKEQHPDLADAWNEEYYVVDDKRLVYLKYDSTNRFLGLEESTDSLEIQKRLEHKKRLLENAIPYKQFLAHLRTNAILVIPEIGLKKTDIQPAHEL